MKFKALFAGVLIGAIALSSCVKNVESPEVTALRNARVDEMRAAAEYSRALAAGETTRAAAQAAYDNARAAYVAAQTETEKARTEQEKAQAKQQMAWAEQQMAQALAQMETDKIQNQIDLLQKQQQLNTELKKMNTQQAAYISQLMNDYVTYNGQLSTAQSNYLNAQNTLAKLEARTVDPNDVVRENISNWETEIAVWQAELDAIDEYLDEDVETLKAKRDELRIAYNDALRVQKDKQTAYQNALNKKNDQINHINADVKYIPMWNDAFNYGTMTVQNFITKYISFTLKDGYGGVVKNQWNEEAKEAHNFYLWEAYYEVKPATGTVADKVILWTSGTENQLDYKNTFDYPEAVDGVYPDGHMTYSIAHYIPAAVYDANIKKIYDAAKASIQAAIDAAVEAEDVATKEAKEAELKTLEEDWKEAEDVLKELAEAKKGYAAEVKTFDELYAAYIQADKERWDANKACTKAQTEFNAINTILTQAYQVQENTYWTYWTIEDRINNLKNSIATNEQLIQTAKETIANNDANYENQIAAAKANVERLKEQVDALQKVVDILKKQLEDALKEVENGAAA